MNGWMGMILNVNLTTLEVTQLPTHLYSENYLGGRGIASEIYWETVPPKISAFDPENRLIFMTGPIVATGSQAANRISVVSKSPMTFPEGYCYGNIGGFFGAELKRAGFDGIIISGRALNPVYLRINDGVIKIQDASSLWGQNAYQTGELLQQTHGKQIRFITTGIAGENLVRSSVLFASHQGACSAGFGAVMGSKNLKAIAVRGTQKVSVSYPKKVKELSRYTRKISARLRLSIPPRIVYTHPEPLVDVIGKGACYQCGVECIRGLYRYSKDLEGYRKCQPMQYYLPWEYSCTEEPIDTLFDAPTLANDYSLDTWELESIVEWLYACFQKGVLTENKTGLPLSKIGTREFLEKLLLSIASRDGFGDVLAEGLVRAAEKVPEQARVLLSRFVAPVGMHDMFPPRVYVVNSLIYPMEPRIHHNILHEIGFMIAAWAANQAEPGITPVTTELFRRIAGLFWGSEEAADVTSYAGKALAAQKIQDRTYLKDSLGFCDFNYPIMYSFSTPNHLGDPQLEAKIFSAVTGVDGDELDVYAERITNLQRMIMIREGLEVPQADFPPDYNFTEPLDSIPNSVLEMVPGPEDEPVSIKGTILDKDKFKGMLKEYYHLRGWDEKTGRPQPETLKVLGQEDLLGSY